MNTLKDVITQISKRPGMFLGDPTISRLEAFLLGWTHDQNHLAGASLAKFQEWVAKRYNVKSSQSWARIISFFSPDTQSAMNEAFTLFEEYFGEDNGKE